MSITIGKINVKEGDSFTVTKDGEIHGLGFAGEIVKIALIVDRSTIGISSEIRHTNWGDLDGRTEPGHGYYISHDAFTMGFLERISMQCVVNRDYKYNNINLKNKKCVVLHTSKNYGISFVELEDNIGGGGCDGLGKQGHCIEIPSSYLSSQMNKAEKVVSKKEKMK